MTITPAVAFLGTGRMGLPMAMNLARAGFPLRAWNRTADRASALEAAGATLAGRRDDTAPQNDAGRRDDAVTDHAGPAPIWVQMSTVGVDWTGRLAADATRRGVTFVDAPVSGSEGPARSGELNNWLVDLVEATAEALTFARGLELDPTAVVRLLQSSPLGSPYAVQKAQAMLAGDFRPAFALKHAIKDAELAVGAAHEGDLVLTEALLPRWRRAAVVHADDDLAAVYAGTPTP